MIFDKKPPTEEEIAAQQAEARKDTAEGEFVIICEDKKRVLSEKISIEKDIEENKGLLDGLKNDITNGQKTIVAITTSISEAKDSLNNLIGEKETISSEIENLKVQFDSEKNKSETKLAEMISSFEDIKKQKEQEIQDFENNKKIVSDEVKINKSYLDNQLKEYDNKEFEVKKLEDNITLLSDQKISLEFEIKKINDTIFFKTSLIEDKEQKIKDLEIVLSNKENDLKDLSLKINKKEEEYKIVESKAFAILQKSDLLAQKEAFIKGQYERAGIKWE